MVAGIQLDYDTNASALEMANSIFGNGVTVVGATYLGQSNLSVIYSDGDAVAGDVTAGDTGVVFSTGSATRFANNPSQSNSSPQTSNDTSGANNDADFTAIFGTSTFDASSMVVDFVPTEDTMTM